jgi:hypothetical protein
MQGSASFSSAKSRGNPSADIIWRHADNILRHADNILLDTDNIFLNVDKIILRDAGVRTDRYYFELLE